MIVGIKYQRAGGHVVWFIFMNATNCCATVVGFWVHSGEITDVVHDCLRQRGCDLFEIAISHLWVVSGEILHQVCGSLPTAGKIAYFIVGGVAARDVECVQLSEVLRLLDQARKLAGDQVLHKFVRRLPIASHFLKDERSEPPHALIAEYQQWPTVGLPTLPGVRR